MSNQCRWQILEWFIQVPCFDKSIDFLWCSVDRIWMKQSKRKLIGRPTTIWNHNRLSICIQFGFPFLRREVFSLRAFVILCYIWKIEVFWSTFGKASLFFCFPFLISLEKLFVILQLSSIFVDVLIALFLHYQHLISFLCLVHDVSCSVSFLGQQLSLVLQVISLNTNFCLHPFPDFTRVLFYQAWSPYCVFSFCTSHHLIQRVLWRELFFSWLIELEFFTRKKFFFRCWACKLSFHRCYRNICWLQLKLGM